MRELLLEVEVAIAPVRLRRWMSLLYSMRASIPSSSGVKSKQSRRNECLQGCSNNGGTDEVQKQAIPRIR
jgi:hypothetical protein